MSAGGQRAGRLALLAAHGALAAAEDWDLLDAAEQERWERCERGNAILSPRLWFQMVRLAEYASGLGLLRPSWAAEVLGEVDGSELFLGATDAFVDANLQARAAATAEVGPPPPGTVVSSAPWLLRWVGMQLRGVPRLAQEPPEEFLFLVSRVVVMNALALALRHPAWTQGNVLLPFTLKLAAERRLLPLETEPPQEITEMAAETAMQIVVQRIDHLIDKAEGENDLPG